jgi:hypothetical protein
MTTATEGLTSSATYGVAPTLEPSSPVSATDSLLATTASEEPFQGNAARSADRGLGLFVAGILGALLGA